MNSLSLTIRTQPKRSRIVFCKDASKELCRLLKGSASPILLITDATVGKLHGTKLVKSLKKAGIQVSMMSVLPGERSKTLDTFAKLLRHCFDHKLDRGSVIIALGGGVVGDLAGFVAATFMRGIRLINVPTTLLAMVDSSIGGKCGVNLPKAKNIAGAFHQPDTVIVDTAFLETLPAREMRNGMAEIIKCAVIADKKLFKHLEQEAPALSARTLKSVIKASIQIKSHIVERDPFETTGLRQLLNFGHTFGHALESVTKFQSLSHGEAVAIGMHLAGLVALSRDMISRAENERLTRLIKQCELPPHMPLKLRPEEVLQHMQRDKKNNGEQITLILPTRIGKVISMPNVSRKEILEALTHSHDAR